MRPTGSESRTPSSALGAAGPPARWPGRRWNDGARGGYFFGRAGFGGPTLTLAAAARWLGGLARLAGRRGARGLFAARGLAGWFGGALGRSALELVPAPLGLASFAFSGLAGLVGRLAGLIPPALRLSAIAGGPGEGEAAVGRKHGEAPREQKVDFLGEGGALFSAQAQAAGKFGLVGGDVGGLAQLGEQAITGNHIKLAGETTSNILAVNAPKSGDFS